MSTLLLTAVIVYWCIQNELLEHIRVLLDPVFWSVDPEGGPNDIDKVSCSGKTAFVNFAESISTYLQYLVIYKRRPIGVFLADWRFETVGWTGIVRTLGNQLKKKHDFSISPASEAAGTRPRLEQFTHPPTSVPNRCLVWTSYIAFIYFFEVRNTVHSSPELRTNHRKYNVYNNNNNAICTYTTFN